MIQQVNINRDNAINNIIYFLQSTGAIKITGINSENEVISIAERLGNIIKNKETDEAITYLSPITSNLKANQRAYTRLDLYPHTDRSPIQNPPDLLMLCCKSPAPDPRGQTILADGLAILQDMAKNDHQHYLALQKPNSAIFCDGNTIYKGSVIENKDNRLSLRFRFDAHGFFNGDIFDSINVLKSYIKKHAFLLRLSAGDAYIVNNKRWLHGRESFEGDRTVYRLLINSFDNLFEKGFKLEEEYICA